MTTKEAIREETIEATGSLREVTVTYPETVAASHKEILRLKVLLIGSREIISERDEEITKLESQIDDLEEEADGEQAEADESLVHHVNQLLDECERVGVRRYRVPETDRVNTAILALHDIAGRNA